ncbi:DUF2087 domain-containing protein [Alloiococcus sp. CFN-8]|uniref:DUF2087 domain-containing protein n=1 Tax=Alloiococcus sp. CFN-8 TaxID=3416081 RepID=UPI003CF83B78
MPNKNDDNFWNASIEEIKRGYAKEEKEICCLVCSEAFTKGRIYEIDGMLFDAQKAAELHVEREHGSMFNYILNMNSSFTGLSDVQGELLALFKEGISDKEVAERMKIAPSTVRNHRFKLREKEKQARLFLVLMDLLKEEADKDIRNTDKGLISDPHKTATTLDDRFKITEEEKIKVISTYFDENGALKSYPAREKKKVIVLETIAKSFKPKKKYTEKEVNRTLQRIFEDYATLRRALIEYGFLDRTNDGSGYWVKE